MNQFNLNYDEILEQIKTIDPIKYGETRNYIDGAVTKLSPYISRGLISTKQIATIVLNQGYNAYQIIPFLKELAWRDYYQQVWIAKNDAINFDIKQPQPNYNNKAISNAILNASTGIFAIDNAIKQLHETGYMHNHMRMYVASIACNLAKSYWKMPAQWMYYYLLDADWASNALSWQWIAGSFSNKKYFANQENINKYFNSNQRNTFLDVSYECIANINTPDVLKDVVQNYATTELPSTSKFSLNNSLPTYVYNFYNLDCNWDKNIHANRVLLLEPSFYKQYPVCKNTIEFIMQLSKNIANINIYVGEFNELFKDVPNNLINYKEHPTNKHYKGVEHSRDWMFDNVKGYYPSFFGYWKNCEKYLKK